MKELSGRTALVTGASGGIGNRLARGLARAGMNVVASGRREDALQALVAGLRQTDVRAEAVAADLFDLSQAEALIDRSEEALGPIDVLVNNAGVEYATSFTQYTREELTSSIDLNLTAPMLLTHRALSGMLARGRGHVVFVASVAGKLGPPYEAAYAASKAGLIALTQSLRAEYLHQPVSFTVVCPGFVAGEGMYQRMVEQGIVSNRVMGSTTLEKLTDKVVDAIRRDQPEVIESGAPVRPMLALSQLAPGLIERAVPRVGMTEMFRRAAAARGRAG